MKFKIGDRVKILSTSTPDAPDHGFGQITDDAFSTTEAFDWIVKVQDSDHIWYYWEENLELDSKFRNQQKIKEFLNKKEG